jgi:hypothetical protein
MRDVPAISQAAQPNGNASALVPQNAAFELTNDFSLTAWMRPININTGQNEGILDHEGQWALSIFNGELACWFQRNPTLVRAQTGNFTQDAWQFVACTLTGTDGCVVRIDPADGSIEQQCEDVTEAAATGSDGLSLGSFQNGSSVAHEIFNGQVDDLRVYSRALSSAELCTLAGRTTCQ